MLTKQLKVAFDGALESDPRLSSTARVMAPPPGCSDAVIRVEMCLAEEDALGCWHLTPSTPASVALTRSTSAALHLTDYFPSSSLAFWLRSCVVSVLISLTTYMGPPDPSGCTSLLPLPSPPLALCLHVGGTLDDLAPSHCRLALSGISSLHLSFRFLQLRSRWSVGGG